LVEQFTYLDDQSILVTGMEELKGDQPDGIAEVARAMRRASNRPDAARHRRP